MSGLRDLQRLMAMVRLYRSIPENSMDTPSESFPARCRGPESLGISSA
jgi:hypothetical protein